jgi:hypothetical protein
MVSITGKFGGLKALYDGSLAMHGLKILKTCELIQSVITGDFDFQECLLLCCDVE